MTLNVFNDNIYFRLHAFYSLVFHDLAMTFNLKISFEISLIKIMFYDTNAITNERFLMVLLLFNFRV